MANFGWAIQQVQAGRRVQRTGWNGKGMFIFHRPAERVRIVNDFMAGDVVIAEHTLLKTAGSDVVVPWTASQSDMHADDWQEFE